MKKSTGMLLLIVLSTFTAACTTDRLRREDATILAAQSARVQRELAAFGESREKTTAARHLTLNRLQQSALEAEANNERKLRVWTIEDDKERQEIYAELLATGDALLARMREADATMAASAALVTNARSRVNTRSEQLTAVTKTLGRLAQKQKLQDQVKFVVDFFKEVDTSMDEVRAAAESASEEAAAVAAVVATEAGEKSP